MDLSSEEQLAVAMHLASSGKDASEIRKKLCTVCGATALPVAALEKCVEEKKPHNEKPQEKHNNVKRILAKKMKMVKVGDCWKPVFVDERVKELESSNESFGHDTSPES